jgi:hypothetical protein
VTAAARDALAEQMQTIGLAARDAAGVLASAPADQRTAALRAAAEAVRDRTAEILAANDRDVAAARSRGVAANLVDRLELTAPRIEGIVRGLLDIAEIPDPVGRVTERWRRPNGLAFERVRPPTPAASACAPATRRSCAAGPRASTRRARSSRPCTRGSSPPASPRPWSRSCPPRTGPRWARCCAWRA